MLQRGLRPELRRKLLVRPCYEDFWQIVRKAYDLQLRNPGDEMLYKTFLFTGVPGIGKSCDGQYTAFKFVEWWNQERLQHNNAVAKNAADQAAVTAGTLTAAAVAPVPLPLQDLTLIIQGTNPLGLGTQFYRFRARRCAVPTETEAIGDAVYEATVTSAVDAIGSVWYCSRGCQPKFPGR